MREMDIHDGKPLVEVAINNLLFHINGAKRDKLKIFAVIVGYGSTGGSHKIKTASIAKLEELVIDKKIKAYIIGNQLDIFSKEYQNFKYRELIPEEEKRILNSGKIFIVL